ncbi:MAG: hypothetical protein ABI876_04255 [Bacteroidota bacterium]
MRSHLYKASLAVLALLLASCGCPDITTGPVDDLKVHSDDIYEFVPDYLVAPTDSTAGIKDDRWSITTFQFPSAVNSGGESVTDSRVSNARDLEIRPGIPFDDLTANPAVTYTARLFTRKPPNGNISGDVMVVSVDPPNSARLRLFNDAQLWRTRQPGMSVQDFVDYIDVNAPRPSRKPNGDFVPLSDTVVPSGGVIKYFDANDVQVGVEGDNGAADRAFKADSRDLDRLIRNRMQALEHDIIVKPGEVYYYVARNGVPFAVYIWDISDRPTGQHGARQNYVAIRFAALRGPEACDAQ